jgi:hypothetical protein
MFMSQVSRDEAQQAALRFQQQLLTCQDQLQEAQAREGSLRQQLAAAEHDVLLLRNKQDATASSRDAGAGLQQERSYGAAAASGPGASGRGYDWGNQFSSFDNPPGRPGVSWSPGANSYAPVADRLDRDQLGRPILGLTGSKAGLAEQSRGVAGVSYDRQQQQQQQQQQWGSPGQPGATRHSIQPGPDSREPWTLPQTAKRAAARSLGWGDSAAVHLSFDAGRRQQQQQQAGGPSQAVGLRRARSTDPPWAISEPLQEVPAGRLYPGSYTQQQHQQQQQQRQEQELAYYSQQRSQQMQGEGLYRGPYQEAGPDPAWSYGAPPSPTYRQQQQQQYTGAGDIPPYASLTNLSPRGGPGYGCFVGQQQQVSPGGGRPPPLVAEQSWPPWQPPGQMAPPPGPPAYQQQQQQQGPAQLQPPQQQQEVGVYSPGPQDRYPWVPGEGQLPYEGPRSSSMAEPDWYPPGAGNAGPSNQQQQYGLVGGDAGGETSPYGTDLTLQVTIPRQCASGRGGDT